jgi:hypothetical protein
MKVAQALLQRAPGALAVGNGRRGLRHAESRVPKLVRERRLLRYEKRDDE